MPDKKKTLYLQDAVAQASSTRVFLRNLMKFLPAAAGAQVLNRAE